MGVICALITTTEAAPSPAPAAGEENRLEKHKSRSVCRERDIKAKVVEGRYLDHQHPPLWRSGFNFCGPQSSSSCVEEEDPEVGEDEKSGNIPLERGANWLIRYFHRRKGEKGESGRNEISSLPPPFSFNLQHFTYEE